MHPQLISLAIGNFLKKEHQENQLLEVVATYLKQKVSSREEAADLLDKFTHILGSATRMLDDEAYDDETTYLTLVASIIGSWLLVEILTEALNN